MNGLPIARLLGIEIRVSVAWMVLIALITFLGAEQAILTAPGLARPVQWLIGLAIALAFLFTVVAHELAHALVGRRRGVPTSGIVLGFLGGTAPMWIQAREPGGELAIAAAGPIVSVVVAAIALPLGFLTGSDVPTGGLAALSGALFVVGGLNAIFAGLSLLPGMPLDGGRIVRAIAWAGTGDQDRASRITVRIGRAIGWMLIGSAIVLALGDLLVGGLLVLGIGWLLQTGASALSGRIEVERLVRGSVVRDAITRDVPTLPPNLTVDTFAERFTGEGRVSALPVVDGDAVLGVVGVRQLQRLPRNRYPTKRASDLMVAPPVAPFVALDDELRPAIDLMNRIGVDGLPVVVDGRLEGMVMRESIGALMLRKGAALDGPPPTGPGSTLAPASRPVSGDLLSVEAAEASVLAGVEPVPELESLAPEAALGRVLAAPVAATTSLPPWDNSAMDGYAIRAADVAGAAEGSPVRLTVVGEVRAGAAPDARVLGGTAIRIATGAPLPPGADAVVPVEQTTPLDGNGVAGPRGREAVGQLPGACLIHEAVAPGNAIRRAGSDVVDGAELLAAGVEVTPAVVALVAGAGVGTVAVRRRAVAAVLATGDEVRPAGTDLGPAGIPDANGPGLRSLVREAGGEPLDLGIAVDRLEDVEGRLRRGVAGADIVIVSGGVSVGPYDVVRTAFDRIGHMDLWRVAVQPGKPFAFGRATVEGQDRPVLLFGLPGNPVSSFVTFELFVRPVIRRLAGHARIHREADRAVLEEPVTKSLGRRGFQRVVALRGADGSPVRDEGGRVRVRLAGGQGSHVLSALAAADALAVVPEPLERAEAGTEVELRWLDRD